MFKSEMSLHLIGRVNNGRFGKVYKRIVRLGRGSSFSSMHASFCGGRWLLSSRGIHLPAPSIKLEPTVKLELTVKLEHDLQVPTLTAESSIQDLQVPSLPFLLRKEIAKRIEEKLFHLCLDFIVKICANDDSIVEDVMSELNRFQPGVKMEISRLDAWYSSGGHPKFPATYIVKGLCRRCCIPEIILRCMQVSISLAAVGDPCDYRDQLIDFVSQNGMLSLFSSHQLQEFIMFERECILCSMEFQEEASFSA